ncbi:MAG TPA: DMT family transporter [Terriglobales bacterium]|nr:DMT family transporter [Terriglobales bacterium]
MASIPSDSNRCSRLSAAKIEGYLLIAAAAFCYGASAAVGKVVFNGQSWLHGTSIDPLILSQARSTFAVLVLLPLVAAGPGVGTLRASRRTLWKCAAMGVLGLCGANFFYYYAIAKSTVATAITVQYTAPVWVYAYTVVARQQRISWLRSLAVVLAFVGCGLVALTAPQAHLKASTIGIVAALGAAFSYSFYNVIGADLLKQFSRWLVLFYALLFSTIFWLIVNPPWRVAAQHYSEREWLFLFGFAIISMLLPFALYLGGLRLLDPTSAIVTSCLEPVFASVLAATFAGEGLRVWQIVGMALVLSQSVVIQLPERGERKRERSV